MSSSPGARRLGTTKTDKMLYAQPASVHFGGFTLETSVHQRVCVYNNSGRAIRLRYTFPTGLKGFRATFVKPNRPSFVSTGLCEEILVTFAPPAGFQYYYDCIQVQCEEVAYGSSSDVARTGATLIPLHAYPVVNEVAFPTRLDFGNVVRGTCALKCVDITCSVPIEFEFELRIIKPHPAFTVFPLTGTIPAQGKVRIQMEFRPLIYATASAELELLVSQLGFVNRVCTLVGSSSDTAETTLAVQTIEKNGSSSASPSFRAKLLGRTGEQTKASKSNPRRHEFKSRTKQSMQLEPQTDDADKEDELEKVRGIEIPRHLNSVTGVAYVLTQEPGKLKPSDLKKAIAANRALQLQLQEQQAKITAVNGEDEEATLSYQTLVREEETYLERIHVSKHVKDMVFQQELKNVADAERALEFQSNKVHLGKRLLTHTQVIHLMKLREANCQALARQQREHLCNMFTTICYKASIKMDPQPLLLGEMETSVLPANFVPAFTPDFTLYKTSMWERRQRVLQRLVRAVSTCILRLRAQKRLDRIQAWLGIANTRVQVREKVILEWQIHAQGSKPNGLIPALPTPQEQHHIDSILDGEQDPRYHLTSFPLVEDSRTQKRWETIEMPADWELKFTNLTYFELKPRDEALVMGHEPLPLPILPTYVPLEETRSFRQGAQGECGLLASLSKADFNPGNAPEAALTMQSHLEMMPSDLFVRPQASVRPLVEFQGPRETEVSYPLRPQRVFPMPSSSFLAWQSEETGFASVLDSQIAANVLDADVFVGSADRMPIFPTLADVGNDQLSAFRDVWNVTNETMPLVAERADHVPNLSDSESDDNGESLTDEALQVSWEHALRLFEDPTSEQDSGKMSELGEHLRNDNSVFCVERFQHHLRQEEAYNAYRDNLLQRLPQCHPCTD